MDDLKSILAHNEGKLPDDMLIAYLEGVLPPEQQHEIEKWLSEEGMESDAIEGLKTLPHADTLHTVNRLNNRLKKELAHRKRSRRYIKEGPWSYLAVVVILLLVVLAYIVLRMVAKR
jgi:hypothetical protein